VWGRPARAPSRGPPPRRRADKRLDALIVLFVPPVVAGADEVAAAIRETVEAAGSDKPVLAVVMSAAGTPSCLLAADSPVAPFQYPESAAHALGVAVAHSEWLRQPAGTVPELDRVDRGAARRLIHAGGGGWVLPDHARVAQRG